MNKTLTVVLPKNKKEKLERLALHYGLSLPELSRRILEGVLSEFPEESLEDYTNPKELKNSLERALRDWNAGRVHARL